MSDMRDIQMGEAGWGNEFPAQNRLENEEELDEK